jgi:hypothetical protein
MKGAVPMEYIVGIVLAISVIAVIGYLFLTRAGIFVGGLSESECMAKAYSVCTLGYGWEEGCNNVIPGVTGKEDLWKEGKPTPKCDELFPT